MLSIGFLTTEPPIEYGHACKLQLPSEFAKREGRYIFIANSESQALVNVDGSDLELKFVSSKGPDIRQPRQLGDRSTYIYSGQDGLAVEVTYEATLTVRRGKAHKTVAAKAACAFR